MELKSQDSTTRIPVTQVKQAIINILERGEVGEAFQSITSAQLKDEPRNQEKKYKTRIFYMSALDNLIVHRMMLSPFYSLMVEHSDIFCCGVGTNMMREGENLHRKLSEFSNCIMEGDYSNFDQCMPYQIGRAAYSVVIKVCSHFGYNEASLNQITSLLNDSLHVYVEMLNDVFMAPGLQPSGKYATAEDNSLRGLVMLMYAWYSDEVTKTKHFFENVKPLVYGDDVLCAVKPEYIGVFNNNIYARVCREKYYLDFTNPQKNTDNARLRHT